MMRRSMRRRKQTEPKTQRGDTSYVPPTYIPKKSRLLMQAFQAINIIKEKVKNTNNLDKDLSPHLRENLWTDLGNAMSKTETLILAEGVQDNVSKINDELLKIGQLMEDLHMIVGPDERFQPMKQLLDRMSSRTQDGAKAAKKDVLGIMVSHQTSPKLSKTSSRTQDGAKATKKRHVPIPKFQVPTVLSAVKTRLDRKKKQQRPPGHLEEKPLDLREALVKPGLGQGDEVSITHSHIPRVSKVLSAVQTRLGRQEKQQHQAQIDSPTPGLYKPPTPENLILERLESRENLILARLTSLVKEILSLELLKAATQEDNKDTAKRKRDLLMSVKTLENYIEERDFNKDRISKHLGSISTNNQLPDNIKVQCVGLKQDIDALIEDTKTKHKGAGPGQ